MTTRHRTSRISLALFFASLFISGVFPSQLMAQDQVSITAQVAEQPGQMSPVNTASLGTDFTVVPSIFTDKVNKPGKLVLNLSCVNNATGQIITFCNITVYWGVQMNTGGHNHGDGTRPPGNFNPVSGNSGSSGVLTTTYTAPEPAGIVQMLVTGYLSDGTPVNAASYTIGVEVPGLIALGAGTGYDLIGMTTEHPDNHYGMPSFNGMLKTLAQSYVSVFPGYLLHYNDMSLYLGGVLDLDQDWHFPHKAHRSGTNIDVRLVPLAQRAHFKQLIYAAGITGIYVEESKNHWHLTQ